MRKGANKKNNQNFLGARRKQKNFPEQKKEIAVQLQNISKIYSLHHEKPTFSEQLIRRRTSEKFVALDNVNLTIYKGEKVGIVGPNGSGKTTILKIIAGITTPTNGVVKTKGKIVSLIELTAGFHPEMTGEENVYLNGLIIGMSKAEIKKRFEKIVKFADIGRFIDAPLYTYSEGMKLRLGFSVAVYADPDILILDEGIVAGDADFQKKSGDKIEEFFRAKKTIIVVTHWLEYLRRHCRRVLFLKKGEMIGGGDFKVIDKYLDK